MATTPLIVVVCAGIHVAKPDPLRGRVSPWLQVLTRKVRQRELSKAKAEVKAVEKIIE
jgi:hypothetical protein